MTADPRLAILAAWMHEPVSAVVQVLAELDAVDPLRKPVIQDRVEAAMDVLYGPRWRGGQTAIQQQAMMASALAAADRVQANAREQPDLSLIVPRLAVKIRDTIQERTGRAVRIEAGWLMDDLTAVVRDIIDPAVRKESLHTDFPPWSREMAALVRELGKFWVRETTDGEVYDRRHAQFLAAFLETPDAG